MITSITRSGSSLVFTDINLYSFNINANSIISVNKVNNNKIVIDYLDAGDIIINFNEVVTPNTANIDSLIAAIEVLIQEGSAVSAGNLLNRVVVQSAVDLQGTLDSSKQYFIDGIIDIGDTQIVVPTGGLKIKGMGFDVSKLISSQGSYTMFTSPISGSGNLVIKDLAVTTSGSGSQVFNIEDNGGIHSLEITGVNFDNCSSRGIVSGYRQVLETNVGMFGGSPELTFDGSFDGYRIDTSLVRGISNITSLYKTTTGTTFSGRVLININADLPATGALIDFNPNNIIKIESLGIKESFVTRNGVLDASDSTLYPNIDNTSVKSVWSDNVGLPNTTKYIKGNITTEVETVISAIDVYYPLLGTITIEKVSHFSLENGNEFQLNAGNGSYYITGNLVLSGSANNEVGIRIVRSTDGGSTFPEDLGSIRRVINNLAGNRDIAYIPLSFLVVLKQGDRIRLEVDNHSGTGNITAEVGSFITINQI